MQFGSHYHALVAGYGAAMLAWLAQSVFIKRLWPAARPPNFARPAVELGCVALALGGIVLLGVLYTKGICLPSNGPVGPVLESLNHLIIFSPVLVLLIGRHQPSTSAWLPPDRIPTRIGAGIVAAVVALTAFSLVRTGADPVWRVLPRFAHYAYLPHLAQVFLEDVSIAVLFVRLGALIRRSWLLALIVGALFAAAHVPTLVAQGLSLGEMGYLCTDFALAVGVILTLQRSRDIWWFFPVHFAMDMTQYASVSGVAFS